MNMTTHPLPFSQGKTLCMALTASAALLLPGIGHAASTCAEVRAQNPFAGDGTYTISVGNQPVDVYCHDMAGTPREYLTLPKTGSTTNYAHYGQSPNTSAGGLKSWYTKARFDPATLALNLGDTTFSTSEGWVRYGTNYVYSQGLGGAADCAAPHSQTGRGNIDLTGTPFDIVPNQFQLNGYLPAGSATPSGSQIVNLAAGGYCGAIGTADGRLQLTLRPSTCAKVREQNPAASDGTYVLSLVHGTRDVQVYCHDMAGTPREYLTLPKTGSTTNYAHYGQSPNTSAGGLKSWYTKARFDPATLALNLGDTTFSTSEGWVRYGTNYVYSQGLGGAADCAAPHSQTGRGNIDLTGTPFDIVPNQFQLNGYLPAGSATPSGSQIVNLAAGGYCGAIGTADGRLQLTLQPVL
ncbi:hypothetical protein F0U62_06775 [Cystobacter fuscus]|uniref:GON domain-containing protein n=1 Tax=Cystobacter fuscus TaxID=43 RepID=UPI002B28CE01|nr:hypothetical protein F0U62_06775 [Cystobacter fuscus]